MKKKTEISNQYGVTRVILDLPEDYPEGTLIEVLSKEAVNKPISRIKVISKLYQIEVIAKRHANMFDEDKPHIVAITKLVLQEIEEKIENIKHLIHIR